jgi:hypothetical protein
MYVCTCTLCFLVTAQSCSDFPRFDFVRSLTHNFTCFAVKNCLALPVAAWNNFLTQKMSRKIFLTLETAEDNHNLLTTNIESGLHRLR